MTPSQPRQKVENALGLSRTVLQAWVMAAHERVRKKCGSGRGRQVKTAKLQRVTTTAATPDNQNFELAFPSGACLRGSCRFVVECSRANGRRSAMREPSPRLASSTWRCRECEGNSDAQPSICIQRCTSISGSNCARSALLSPQKSS